MNIRQNCAISVDVDSLESLNRFHGLHQDHFIEFDPIFQKAVPRFLRLFYEMGITATFFVIGKDCSNPANRDIIREIVSRGHEIANHSFSHVFGFSTLSVTDKKEEIEKSTQIIKDACGYEPVGFRTPGYDIDEDTMALLDEAGYLYDSSVYSFCLYPVMRRIRYKMSRQNLKGGVKNLQNEFMPIFSPLEIYRPMSGKFWRRGEGRNIVEIPVSLMPYLRVPFNSTFLFLLGPKLFDFGFWLAKKNNASLNYIFHASDMLCASLDKIRLKHPGVGMDLEKKQKLFFKIFRKIDEHYEFMTLEKMARLSGEKRFAKECLI